MSDIAIRLENISKMYHLGSEKSQSISELFKNLFNSAQIEKKISEFWALKDISFDIKQGDAVGIIGKNGAGKSTLLKILSRITEPTSGRIEINGRVSSLLEVGTGFHPELTGRENIFLNGTILGMKRSEIKQKFDEIVDFSGVEKFLDTPVKHYSSGMYVRLAFAVAAHLEPEILIIDEVLAVGDAEFQNKCLGKMKDVAGQGRTVLFVSHNMVAVKSICSKSILLRNGTIYFNGDTDKAINTYLTNTEISNRLNFNDIERSGNGKIKYKNFTIIKNDEIVSKIKMGESVKILLEFECFEPIRNPVFGVSLRSSIDQRLISWRTFETSQEQIPSVKNNGAIILEIKNLNLLPERYFFAIGISENNEQIDYIEKAFHIDIIADDVYATGKIPSASSSGFFFTECQWRIKY
jgi:lipopolysaccharide transport system ATP-binding protein